MLNGCSGYTSVPTTDWLVSNSGVRKLSGHTIVDFVCYEKRLVIEADGGLHAGPAEDDKRRTAFLESLGYRVARYWNHTILNDTEAVLEDINRCLINAPSPQPSPGGRGG